MSFPTPRISPKMIKRDAATRVENTEWIGHNLTKCSFYLQAGQPLHIMEHNFT